MRVRRQLRQQIKAILQPGIDTLGYTANSYVDLKSQANELASTLIRFDEAPTTEADRLLLEALHLLRPVQVEHARLHRVGGEGDGGYVMLNADPAKIAVSIGVGRDVSWDRAVAHTGATVHMFDHTVRRLPEAVPGGTFHRLGVGLYDGGKLRNLKSLMRISGVSGAGPAFLKFDVEGAEWAFLAACESGLLGTFSQIVAELHGLDRLASPESSREVLRSLALLSQEHVPIHVHPNNYSRVVKFGTYWFPREIEVSWVHRSLIDNAEPARTLATDLDRPCDPRVSEVDISGLMRLPNERPLTH